MLIKHFYTPRQLWLCLAGLVALNSIVMSYRTQTIELTILTALVWGGAFICIEDLLLKLQPSPSISSLLIGSALILAGLIRSALVFHIDVVVYGLALMQALGLVLLLAPVNQLNKFLGPLLIISITVLLLVPIASLLPEEPLSLLTAEISGVFLKLTGQDVIVMGREVWMNNSGVRVSGPCSGRDMMHQLFIVGLIFAIAIPIRPIWLRIIIIFSTPVFSILGNSFRIATLALINGSDLTEKNYWFTYFHENEGSLVFSAISTTIFAWCYLKLIDKQISTKVPRND